MNKFIKDYLTFTKSERNGLIVLSSIIIILLFFLEFSYVFFKEKNSDFSKFENEIGNFQKSLILKDSVKLKNDSIITLDSSRLKFFDPNFTDDTVWKQFGLSEKQIKIINNYISKGGKFYKKEDFKKIYCINEELYQILEPYIIINRNNKKNNEKIITENFVIEINSADSTDLKKIHNLRISIIKRILKFRDLTGGFYKKEQLLEVYGLKAELFKSIEKFISVDSTKITKLNINTATFKELTKSLYINYSEAKSIVNLRQKNGKFNNINQVLVFNLVSRENFEKMKHYLVVD